MNALKSLNLLVISLIVVATFSCKKRGTSNSSLRADDEEVANFRDTVSFMGLNDLHGNIRVKDYVLDSGNQKITTKIGGFNTIQEYFRSLQALNPNSVLLDAGDVYQGTIISNYFQGLSLVDSYEKLVVTASTFGNHEFDYGEAQVEPGSKLKKSNDKQGAIKEIIDQAKFGYLSVNVMKADGSPLHDKIKKSKVIELNGVKIGIIGATTTATPTQTVAANVEGLKFGKFIDHVPFEAERLRREDGVSFVILLTHAGGDCDMTLDSRDGDKACQDLSLSAGTGVVADEVTEFIRQLPLRNSDGGPNLLATVDAVFAGHRHRPQAHFISNIDTATKTPPLGVKLTVPVLQTTGFGKSFSMLDVTFNRNSSPLDSLQTRVLAFKIHKPTYLCYEHFENLKDCNPELESVFKGQYPNNFGGKVSPKFRGQSLSLSNLIDDQTNLASGDEKQALSPFLDIISKSFGNIDRVVVKELPNALSQDRTRESKMANCVVDTVLDQYNEKKLPSEKVDLMIMNSSAIRDQLNAGRITFEMLFAISPFSAKLSVMKLTRDELEALGRSLSKNLPNSVAVISKGWQVALAKDKNISPNHKSFIPPQSIRNKESFNVLTNDFNALPNGPHEAVLAPIRPQIQILDLDLLALLEAGLKKQPLLESCTGAATNRTIFASN